MKQRDAILRAALQLEALKSPDHQDELQTKLRASQQSVHHFYDQNVHSNYRTDLYANMESDCAC